MTSSCPRLRWASSAIQMTSRRSLVFLASDESHYITGQTVGADGGSTMF